MQFEAGWPVAKARRTAGWVMPVGEARTGPCRRRGAGETRPRKPCRGAPRGNEVLRGSLAGRSGVRPRRFGPDGAAILGVRQSVVDRRITGCRPEVTRPRCGRMAI